MAAKQLLSDQCSIAVNHLASYELHVSDAYLSMACNSTEDSVEPFLADFLEDQADVKRENGKQFLKYLQGCGSKICLPVIKRPEIDNWGTGIKALEHGLELENQLTKLLVDLKTTASSKNEYGVLNFFGKFLDEQNKNTNYLQFRIECYKELENMNQEEKDLFKKPGEVLGEKEHIWLAAEDHANALHRKDEADNPVGTDTVL
ncbi:ferritin, heavy subunit-like [Eptesicus fuscus]|uniref:ferritin, heavy subunit-like n=1 Tax=Eptesicus fuscus TaxID=29078 RepID=UPI002403C210|nr:ferritin, heavy subunit-like [Eptesicus fuscus]